MAFAVAALWAAAPQAATATCKSEYNAFLYQIRQMDLMAAQGALPGVERHCPAAQQVRARNILAVVRARLAMNAFKQGGDPAALAADLTANLHYGDHWEIQRALGEFAEAVSDYPGAARHFTTALNLIEDETLTPKAPDEATIVGLHNRATDAMALSDKHVEMPRTRSNLPSAYWRASLRGVKVPVKRPRLTFVFNESSLDAEGISALEELVGILAREAPREIVIIGHADARGTDSANHYLSVRRVSFVGAALQELGYGGGIQLAACGERVAVEINNPERFDVMDARARQEAIYKLHRRVEVYYDVGDVPAGRYDGCQWSD